MTITPEKIQKNQNLIGRGQEIAQLKDISVENEARIIVMSGRRRVGKTELLEQSFKDRCILKFEGIEGRDEKYQQMAVLRQLSRYTDDALVSKINVESWLDVFDVIYRYTQSGVWTIYFEEVQWLANYQANFISELKYAWDNQFRRNNKIILILCGSSPSFMVKQVLHSKSLYNRSQHEIRLQPFSIHETKLLLGKRSNREVMNAYLTIGGIPEYLKRVKNYSSVFSGICEQSFLPDSYFSQEFERIFVSSMNDNPHYQKIIEFLSKNKFATRSQIAKHLKIKTGGSLTQLLEELELCTFIKKYSPYNLKENSKLTRYQINDAYLQFFYKFIKPKLSHIKSGAYLQQPTSAIKINDYHRWLGYAFERYCRDNQHQIADILRFSGVHYRSGAYYNRAAITSEAGYQIDLLFDRDDHVVTLCEIKYTQGKVGTSVIEEFEKKLQRFDNKKNKTIHKVLISASGIDQALRDYHYFDAVITLDDLMA